MTRPKPKKPPRVAGEPVDALVEALLSIDTRPRPDGMVELEGRFRPAIGAPFARALMRVEAELLLADARPYGTDAEQVRSPDARRADALLLLARRVSATAASRSDRRRER